MSDSELIGLDDARALCRTIDGRPPSYDAIRGWCVNGLKTTAGRRVYLKSCRVGRRFYTKPAWVRDFESEVDRGTQSQPQAPGVRPLTPDEQLAVDELGIDL